MARTGEKESEPRGPNTTVERREARREVGLVRAVRLSLFGDDVYATEDFEDIENEDSKMQNGRMTT